MSIWKFYEVDFILKNKKFFIEMRKMGAAAAKIKLISCKMKSQRIRFLVIKKDGDKLSYQCNLCKPRMITANIQTRFNLKRHLSTQHGRKDIDNFEDKIAKTF